VNGAENVPRGWIGNVTIGRCPRTAARVRGVLLAGALGLALASGAVPAWAESAPGDQLVVAGVAAARQGDFAAALRLFEQAAALGNAGAKLNLSLMHERGQGVARDPERAAFLLLEAARGGNPLAQFQLGLLLEQSGDRPTAITYHRQAADQGFGPAQARLALFYTTGTGVPRDQRAAFRLAGLAAQQREPEAYALLGQLYANGHGTPRNLHEAWYWFSLAERDHPDPAQREWAKVSRMRAANSIALPQIERLRQRVAATAPPGAN
jgi:TPR repeat protein